MAIGHCDVLWTDRLGNWWQRLYVVSDRRATKEEIVISTSITAILGMLSRRTVFQQ